MRDPRLRPEFFSGFLFATACISCVYNCNDLPSNKSSLRSSHIWFSYIYNFIIILSRVYHELIQRPAPSWLVNLIGRALHQYRRCQGFESRTSLNFFFQAFLFATAWLSCVYNCDDLPSNNSSLRSSHIWFSYIHNFKSETCFNQSEALWVVTPHWSSSVDPRALVRRRFSGEPVVVGHSQANRQSILKLSTHCFFVEGYFLTSQFMTVIASCFRRCYKLTYSLKKFEI